MRTFNGLDDVAAAVGEHLGHTEWQTITQEQVNLFADATDDHQWIHVDAERAATGPFGSTIAHGFLTLALIPSLGGKLFQLEGITMGINYGTNKVRFPQPVPVGARIRAGVEVLEATPGRQGMQVVWKYVIEIEGLDKPACVAETVTVLVA
ncbi:MAG: MaoC family dehydratase [Nocardioidaceae bacterium]|jgi:acyl dehydratase|nr:MaoC family dehydratase [Nocardioidaceae bacterium]